MPPSHCTNRKKSHSSKNAICGEATSGYYDPVQRHSALAILLFLGLSLLIPAMSAGESQLPACCRHEGAHHCSMVAHCDSYPAGLPAGFAALLAASAMALAFTSSRESESPLPA